MFVKNFRIYTEKKFRLIGEIMTLQQLARMKLFERIVALEDRVDGLESRKAKKK